MKTWSPQLRGAAAGLAAAALFGASAPLAKRFLAETGPLMLASLLYLGAGVGLSLYSLARPRRPGATQEARLRRPDALPLLGVIVCGGILGPVLMLAGLDRTSAVAGALLLNLEAPFTMLLAITLFGEHLGGRALLGAAVIVAGGALLAWAPGELRADLWGVLAITGACAAWGLDNNLTQRLSLRDPVRLVRLKTLGAGTAMLLVAVLSGSTLPSAAVIAGALFVGSLSYGASIALDAYALRRLGAAREAAYFATAPFIGALLAIPIAHQSGRALDLLVGLLMAAGVVLVARERHGHEHAHAELEHEHAHVHDEHHQHEHDGPITEPHAHPHHHSPLTHEHPHVPDQHHRHKH